MYLDFPGVTFHPWIGAAYGGNSRYGLRLLVPRESHWGPDIVGSTGSGLNRKIVKSYGQKQRSKFFTMTANILRGERGYIDDDTRRKIWDSVAFYNLVQAVFERPRKAPSFRQWVDAQEPLQTVLRVLQPKAVLVLGHRVCDHILDRPADIEFETIKHPSSRAGYGTSIEQFEELLDRSGGSRMASWTP